MSVQYAASVMFVLISQTQYPHILPSTYSQTIYLYKASEYLKHRKSSSWGNSIAIKKICGQTEAFNSAKRAHEHQKKSS